MEKTDVKCFHFKFTIFLTKNCTFRNVGGRCKKPMLSPNFMPPLFSNKQGRVGSYIMENGHCQRAFSLSPSIFHNVVSIVRPTSTHWPPRRPPGVHRHKGGHASKKQFFLIIKKKYSQEFKKNLFFAWWLGRGNAGVAAIWNVWQMDAKTFGRQRIIWDIWN